MLWKSKNVLIDAAGAAGRGSMPIFGTADKARYSTQPRKSDHRDNEIDVSRPRAPARASVACRLSLLLLFTTARHPQPRFWQRLNPTPAVVLHWRGFRLSRAAWIATVFT